MEIKLPKTKTAYSFIEQTGTGRVHVFEGEITSEDCAFTIKSMCEAMSLKEDESRQLSICMDENEAKLEADSNAEVVCEACLKLI